MTLAIQEYLAAGNTPESLEARGIYSYRHPNLPLIGFKYDQIEAKKSDKIVQEARGIVLELDTWRVVAKAFDRFFNLGEFPELMESFNWNEFTATTKEDGSLILLYHYAGAWHVNTSGSFGLGLVNRTDKTWRDLFWQAAKELRKEKLNTRFTYVFELCTPYNKVVRQYLQSQVFLLSVFDPTDNCYEFSESAIDSWADILGVRRPVRFTMNNRDELAEWLVRVSETDPTFEGFVLRDTNNSRWKAKTESYCALHHLKDNGNILIASRLATICLSGESDEVKATLKKKMPEISTALDTVDTELKLAYTELEARWNAARNIPSQKEFAMAVKDHKFSGFLFQARKSGQPLNKIWRSDAEYVSDRLFGKRTFEFDEVANANSDAKALT
jgi:hypothetical protein